MSFFRRALASSTKVINFDKEAHMLPIEFSVKKPLIKSRPPNFLIFSSSLDIPKNYRKFLTNGLRDQFDLKNVPIRLGFRVGKNPYVKN